MSARQIWEERIPIPTTIEQVRREEERQRICGEESKTAPDTCPNCGCQMFDPFAGIQIHFIEECDK